MAASTVLVIEDDVIQREGLAAVLRQQGFTVFTAVDGQDALHKLSSDPIPDLLLLDMLIPGGGSDGWWFLRQRQSIDALASVPVIITTAIPVADMKWVASLGAAGLLRKPFDRETPLSEIWHCLGETVQA